MKSMRPARYPAHHPGIVELDSKKGRDTFLKKGVTSTPKKDARQNNIDAARLVADTMRSSFGPNGMDKLCISNIGVLTVTNDGFSMFKELDVRHPAAKVLKDLAWTTHTTVGDGTISAVLLAGALLEKGNELMRSGVHPSRIVSGYGMAAKEAVKVLERDAESIDTSNRKALAEVAKTALTGKIFSVHADHVARVAVEAALTVLGKQDDHYFVDVKDIIMEKKDGASMAETRLIKGRIIEQKFGIPEMPRRVENARIALFKVPFKSNNSGFVSKGKAKVTITNPKMVGIFAEREKTLLKGLVDKVIAVGANVVITEKENSPLAQYYFAKAGIMSLHKVQELQIPTISKMTGATIISNPEHLTKEDLGYAELVEESDLNTDDPKPGVLPNRMVFLDGCREPKAVTVFVRASTKRTLNEAERSIKAALMTVKDALEDPFVVVGGGATEAEAAFRVRKMAQTLEGHEQLAVMKFAEALEEIPSALATNGGLDAIDALTILRARHANGGKWYGIGTSPVSVRDLHAEQVFEPLSVKRQVIRAAVESVATILRVDWVMVKPNTNKGRFMGGSQG